MMFLVVFVDEAKREDARLAATHPKGFQQRARTTVTFHPRNTDNRPGGTRRQTDPRKPQRTAVHTAHLDPEDRPDAEHQPPRPQR